MKCHVVAFVCVCFHQDADNSRPITANSEDTPGDTLTKVMDVNSFSCKKSHRPNTSRPFTVAL